MPKLHKLPGNRLLAGAGILLLAAVAGALYLYKTSVATASVGPVTLVVARRGKLKPVMVERGLLQAYRNVQVFSNFNGEVERMVPEGTQAKKGDPIIWFRTDKLDDQEATVQKNLVGDLASLREKQNRYLVQEELYGVRVRLAEIALQRSKLYREKVYGRPLEIEPFEPMRWARNTLFGMPETRSMVNLRMDVAVQTAVCRREETELDSLREMYEKGVIGELKLWEKQLSTAKARAALASAELRRRLAQRGPSSTARRKAEMDVLGKTLNLEKVIFEQRADLEIARQEILRAQIEVDRSDRELDRIKRKRDFAIVRAPIDGKVAFVDIWKGSSETLSPLQVGEVRGRHADLCRVADDSMMRVSLLINEVDVPKLRVGMPARIRVPALEKDGIPLDTFPGEIAEISARAKDRNIALGSLALLKNGEAFVKVLEVFVNFRFKEIPDQYRRTVREKLRRGMSAVVEIELDPVAEGVIVPSDALFQPPPEFTLSEKDRRTIKDIRKRLEGTPVPEKADAWAVVFEKPGVYALRPVRIVAALEDAVVVEGIREGEKLVDKIAARLKQFDVPDIPPVH